MAVNSQLSQWYWWCFLVMAMANSTQPLKRYYSQSYLKYDSVSNGCRSHNVPHISDQRPVFPCKNHAKSAASSSEECTASCRTCGDKALATNDTSYLPVG